MISSCTATPVLSLPSVEDQCIPAGSSMVSVMWDEVTANNTDGQNVTCWDSVGGGNVPLTGRHFGVGLHTVNCSVSNDGNCTGTGSFTFTVTGTYSMPVLKSNLNCH